VPSHSADPPSRDAAAVAVPALRSGLAAELPALPGLTAAGNGGDDRTVTAVLHSPATAADAGDVPGETASTSFAYIYGYDAAGNPTLTLTDAGGYSSSDRRPPD
jgi:hypothetical protein